MPQIRNNKNLTARQQARLDRKMIKQGLILSDKVSLIDKMKKAKTPEESIEIFESFQLEKIEELRPWKINPYKKEFSKSSEDFLSSFQWRKLRLKALDKYGHMCSSCGASPESGAVLNVDHIKPRKYFPHLSLDINNLQVLCSECNHGKGNWNHSDYRKGQLKKS